MQVELAVSELASETSTKAAKFQEGMSEMVVRGRCANLNPYKLVSLRKSSGTHPNQLE